MKNHNSIYFRFRLSSKKINNKKSVDKKDVEQFSEFLNFERELQEIAGFGDFCH